MTTSLDISAYSRPLSKLHSANTFLDPESYIEVSKKTGTSSYASYKTTLRLLSQSIIDNFTLYKNLTDIFDSVEYPNDTYFGKTTTFKDNPYIQKENDVVFDALTNNQLASKGAVDEYLREHGICIPACTPTSKYVYYSSDEKRWVTDSSGSKIPKVLGYTNDGIWTSRSKLKFNYGHNLYCFTDLVEAPKNIMLDVTGNILLNEDYQKDWYEADQVSFVGLTVEDESISVKGKLITLTFLKNILLLEKDGKKYVIGQFHFHCPIAKGTKFRIITNAECKLFGVPEKDLWSKKLYNSLNAVNLSYYDYGTN